MHTKTAGQLPHQLHYTHHDSALSPRSQEAPQTRRPIASDSLFSRPAKATHQRTLQGDRITSAGTGRRSFVGEVAIRKHTLPSEDKDAHEHRHLKLARNAIQHSNSHGKRQIRQHSKPHRQRAQATERKRRMRTARGPGLPAREERQTTISRVVLHASLAPPVPKTARPVVFKYRQTVRATRGMRHSTHLLCIYSKYMKSGFESYSLDTATNLVCAVECLHPCAMCENLG